MIIHPIRTTHEDDRVIQSVKVEIENPGTHSWCTLSETLWYSFPKEYEAMLPKKMDGFLLPLLPVALFFGEDVFVRGEISPELYYNLHEYQRILHFWHPEWFTPVRISCDGFAEAADVPEGRGTMCSFSGGIDSSFTLWSHMKENEPIQSERVTHALYVRDFDIRESRASQDIKIKRYRQLLKQHDVTLIDVTTNAVPFHLFNNGAIMYFTYATIITGIASSFEKVIDHFSFSADNVHSFSTIFTINHTVVPLFSTDTVRTSVFGASVNKLEKVREIAKWPGTYENLACCHEYPEGPTNCGRCEKCCNITCVLACLGLLGTYTTFPSHVTHRWVRKNLFLMEYIHYPKMWMYYAWVSKKYAIFFDYTYVLVVSYFLHYYWWMIRIIAWPIDKLAVWVLNPMRTLYKISFFMKKHSPTYTRFVAYLKGETQMQP